MQEVMGKPWHGSFFKWWQKGPWTRQVASVTLISVLWCHVATATVVCHAAACPSLPSAPPVTHLGTWNNGHASQLFVNSVTPLAKAERQAQCVCNYWKTKNLQTEIFRKSKLTSFCACVCTHAVQSMSAQCTCVCRCMGKPENNLWCHASRTMHLLFWRLVLPLAWSSVTRLHWLVMAPGTCLLPLPRSQIAGMHHHA